MTLYKEWCDLFPSETWKEVPPELLGKLDLRSIPDGIECSLDGQNWGVLKTIATAKSVNRIFVGIRNGKEFKEQVGPFFCYEYAFVRQDIYNVLTR